VGGDVVEDGVGKVAVVAFTRGDARDLTLDFFTNGSGADIDVEAGQEMERRGGSGGVAQRAGAQLDGGDWRGKAGFEREACGQSGGQVREVLARARSDDEGRYEWDFGTSMPVPQGQERVGAQKAEKLTVRGQVSLECNERVKCVVGGVVGREVGCVVHFGSVGEGESEAWLVGYGETCHGDAIFEAGGGTEWLERLCTHGSEEDGFQIESGLSGVCHGEMAAVGRVETSSKKRDTGTFDHGLEHGFMVMP
jgi:hypothetical protein